MAFHVREWLIYSSAEPRYCLSVNFTSMWVQEIQFLHIVVFI